MSHEAVTQMSKRPCDQMDGQLLQMKADLAKIDQQYLCRSLQLQNDQARCFSSLSLSFPMSSQAIRVTGQDAKSDKTGESTLFLSSKTVVPGGYDFDWRHGTVNEWATSISCPQWHEPVDFMVSGCVVDWLAGLAEGWFT